MSSICLEPPRIEQVSVACKFHTTVSVLRLDLVHPVVSGNKWFKLHAYLEAAARERKKTIVTFGGAFSNHILATAAAAREAGFRSIGIIRGEAPATLSPTLQDARGEGMELHFVSRSGYRAQQVPQAVWDHHDPADLYLIHEGGYGQPGAAGAGAILQYVPPGAYDHIIAAVGTGTMLAGLVAASAAQQSVTGIPVMKNNFALQAAINRLLPPEQQDRFTLVQGYHFGGYARHQPALFRFMNDWYHQTSIPSDFVYTGKLFYAVNELLQQAHFTRDSRLLVIHSGGLQGNRSLPKGTLIF